MNLCYESDLMNCASFPRRRQWRVSCEMISRIWWCLKFHPRNPGTTFLIVSVVKQLVASIPYKKNSCPCLQSRNSLRFCLQPFYWVFFSVMVDISNNSVLWFCRILESRLFLWIFWIVGILNDSKVVSIKTRLDLTRSGQISSCLAPLLWSEVHTCSCSVIAFSFIHPYFSFFGSIVFVCFFFIFLSLILLLFTNDS